MNCPVYPPPLKKKSSLFGIFFKWRHSWLHVLYERSYRMKMGHWKLPGHEVFMPNQPALVREVLVENVAQFPKHRMMGEVLEPLLGESIFTTNGRQWQKQRQMLEPSFELVRMQHVLGLMQAAVAAQQQRLAAQAGTVVDIDAEMTLATADIIFRTILSVPLESAEAQPIFEAFVEFQAVAPTVAVERMFRWPRWLASRAARKRHLASGAVIRKALEAIIRPRFEAARAGAAGGEQDILGSILQAVDEDSGAPFALGEVVDQVAMLFLAGHETSASALTWTCYLLTLDEKVQAAAHAEVLEICGQRPIGSAEIKALHGVRNLFREALRLYPPVGFFARECAHAGEMRGKTMPAGSSVLVSPWLIHRHRDYWDKPDDFDPSRFERERMAPLRDAFLPFGMGPRVCIGVAFAIQEAVLILASLLRSYRLVAVPGFVPQPIGRITIRSANGMQVMLEPRSPPL